MKNYIYRKCVSLYIFVQQVTLLAGGQKAVRFVYRFSIILRYIFFPSFSRHLISLDATAAMPSLATQYQLDSMPRWLINDIRTTGKTYDAEVYFEDNDLHKYQPTIFANNPLPGQTLRKIIDLLSHPTYEVISIVPSYSRGGSEKQARCFVDTLKMRGGRILSIVTDADNKESVILSKLQPKSGDSNETFIYIPNFIDNNITSSHWEYMLAYLVCSIRPKVLYTTNSRLGYGILTRFGRQIASSTNVVTGAWCYDYDQLGREVGYISSTLPLIYKYLTAIICDNTIFPRTLAEYHGYDLKKFHVLPAPVTSSAQQWSPPPAGATPRVLWAGRWCKQKRIDLLIDIARLLPNVDFYIYGYPTDSTGYTFSSHLSRVSNIFSKGPYDYFSEINLEQVSLFLYTSSWDGLPNVLLEAAAAGLPIVTSLVGGIGDTFDDETALTVPPFSDADQYATAIQTLLADPTWSKVIGAAARARVIEKHSQNNYESVLRNIREILI